MYVGEPTTLGKAGKQHSQAGQDWLVATLLGCKRRGYFVELAANNASFLSNSLMLERDFGWDGLCIEPNTAYQYGHGSRRCALVSAAVASPANGVVHFSLQGAQSTLYGKSSGYPTVSLQTVPLESVLKRVGAPTLIDFMSLDVEGAEEAVLGDFPFGAYRFSVITVERPTQRLAELLRSQGYHFLRLNARFNDQTWISGRLPSFDIAMNDFPSLLKQSCMAQLGYGRPRQIKSRSDFLPRARP